MTDDFAIEGEDAGYVPCRELPAPLDAEEEGAIYGIASGYVARNQAALASTAPERAAIVGSGVGFVPAPCAATLVAVAPAAPSGKISTSLDGIDWELQDSGGFVAYSVTYSDDLGLFLIGGLGVAGLSEDGINWTWHAVSGWAGLAIGDSLWSPELGLFVISSGGFGSTGRVGTSPDGINWTTYVIPNVTDDVWLIGWSGDLGQLLAWTRMSFTADQYNSISSDGVNWDYELVPGGYAGFCGVWISELGLWVTAGGRRTLFGPEEGHDITIWFYRTSPDGVNWTEYPYSNSFPYPPYPPLTGYQATIIGFIWEIIWSPELGLGLMVGQASADGSILMTSPDATTWTAGEVPAGWGINPFGGVTYSANAAVWSSALGLFVIGGDGGRLATSPDGINWTIRTSQVGTSSIRRIATSA